MHYFLALWLIVQPVTVDQPGQTVGTNIGPMSQGLCLAMMERITGDGKNRPLEGVSVSCIKKD